MINPASIDTVRDLPIEDVLSRYVELKKSGSALKACCPLHGEKTPSFVVTPAKNIFKCFGCGKGGDAIAFVMAHDNLPFYDAIESIAAAHGIELKYSKDERTPEQKNEHTTMHTLLTQAQEMYCKLLIDTI